MNPKKISRSAADAIARKSERQYFESLIRADYERCHPDDSFDDLKQRVHLTKEEVCCRTGSASQSGVNVCCSPMRK